jgi:hypothetical protein
MIDIILLGAGILFSLTGAFLIGKEIGKRSRKIGLSELGSPAMFAYLLTHERHRHAKDLSQIDKDLADMAKLGINAPEGPYGLWIEVKR